MRISLFLIFIFSFVVNWSQNLVVDDQFERLGEFYSTEGLNIQWHKGVFSKGGILPEKTDDNTFAVFRFSVNSVRVDPNFIVAQISEELKAGGIYHLEISIRKDRLSPFSMREMQVCFGSSFNQNTSFLHGASIRQIVPFDLSQVSSAGYIRLTMDYQAQGGEEFIYLGSLAQTFSIVESTKLGLLVADRTYSELPYNCTYYVDEIVVEETGHEGDDIGKSIHDNWFNLKGNLANLIINGGGEYELKKRHFTNEVTSNSTGSLIAPYAYSLTQNCPEVNQLDSNDYRSEYDVNRLCYMGDGQFILDALRTNVYHEYGEATWKQEGQDYDTYHVYEKAPYQQILPYAIGEYLVLPLKDKLQKNQTYHWSSMIKMSEEGSYGIQHLGVHFLDEFPENISDSLWQRYPEDVIDVTYLTKSQAWSEFSLSYTARGGERFVVIGHLPVLNEVVRNQMFKRDVYSSCGPHEYNCSDRYVYYKDSLFARYQIDNMVLVKGAENSHLSIVYEEGKRVQLEIVFNEIAKTEKAIEKLEKVKVALIHAQQVLRVEDAICIVDQRKKDPIIFDPNPIINKKRIIKKLNKPKPVKKVKLDHLPPEVILFGEGKDEVNLNHLVLIGDEFLDIELSEQKLVRFTKNGGNLTVFYIGKEEAFENFKLQFSTINNAIVLNASDLNSYQLVRIILEVN